MYAVARSIAGPRLLHPDFTVGSGLSPDHAHPHHAGGLAGCTADRELPAKHRRLTLPRRHIDDSKGAQGGQSHSGPTHRKRARIERPCPSNVKTTSPQTAAATAPRPGTPGARLRTSAIATPPRNPPHTSTGRHGRGTGTPRRWPTAENPYTVRMRTARAP